MTERVYLFKGFERFWHWTQALLVMTLLFTGFEIHGTYKALGFARAVDIHTLGAWSLVGLWVFAVFWHLTTGEWRHYIPTTGKLLAMARYYSMDRMVKRRVHALSALQPDVAQALAGREERRRPLIRLLVGRISAARG